MTITNMEPIKNVGRRAAIWNFKAFSGIDPNYETLITRYVNADLDPPLPPLLLGAEAGYGGTMSPSAETAARHNSEHTYTITANPGFTIKDVIVDGKNVGPVSTYSFDNISHTILARFSNEKRGDGSIPRTKDLLLSCLADSLPAQGEIDSWSTQFPNGGSLASISNPSVSLIDGHKFASIAAGDGDGFRFGTSYSSNIDCDGFSIVVALRHRRHTIGDAWNSVVDIFYDRLQLGVYNNTGRVYVRRNGDAQTSHYVLADRQVAILGLVVQPDGTYKAFVDNEEIMSGDSTSQMTSLVPGVAGDFGRFINLGRNNPDAWSTFNGDIGDVCLYRVALSNSDREKLVTYIGSRLVDDIVATTPRE